MSLKSLTTQEFVLDKGPKKGSILYAVIFWIGVGFVITFALDYLICKPSNKNRNNMKNLLMDHRFHALIFSALLAFVSYRDLYGEKLPKQLLQIYLVIGVLSVAYHGYELVQ